MKKYAHITLSALLVAGLLAVGSTPAFAGKMGVMAMDAWVRAVPSTNKNSAAYMMLKNNGSKDIKLVGASTSVAEVAEVHEVVKSDGMMEMRQVKGGINIPKGGSVMLKQGGYHIMLINLTQKLMKDQVVTLELKFDDGSTLSVKAPVKMGKGMTMKH